MILSFVILEVYFFIVLIADVLFIYLICIREPKTKAVQIRFNCSLVWGPFSVIDFFMFCVIVSVNGLGRSYASF